MNELRNVVVFEVDHPSTQAYKRPRVATRVPAALEVRFVAVDFERDKLDDCLARAGHDAKTPTFWLWEGVTPYLGIDAVRATLAAVRGRSAEGSRIAVTYATRAGSTLGPLVVRAGIQGFRLLGEEVRGLIDTSAMHEELLSAGFRVVQDTSAQEWGTRYGGDKKRRLLIEERLAVGVRAAGAV